MSSRHDIDEILRSRGVLVLRQHRDLRRTAQRMAKEGVLRSLAPGVLCRWQDSATPEVRLRAAAEWMPDGVLTGPAAARLTFWPEIAVRVISISSSAKRSSPHGFEVTRERLDPELIAEVGGHRVTVPALTALDLVASEGGEGIDRVLRLRKASLDDMAEVLRFTPNRRGNAERREMLMDSRDEPWSEAEREGHRLLRAAGITGWRGNVPVLCGETLYFLDIGFKELKLGIEIDGREVHRAENRGQFNHDRRKWTELHNAGWALLHYAADHVFDEGDWFLHTVRTALILRGWQARLAPSTGSGNR